MELADYKRMNEIWSAIHECDGDTFYHGTVAMDYLVAEFTYLVDKVARQFSCQMIFVNDEGSWSYTSK